MFCDINDEKSNQRFISFDNYSVSERVYSHDEAIELQEELSSQGFFVDESIAQAISELNKKGYTTSSCCSGHVLKDRHPIIDKQRNDILDFLPRRRQYLSPQNGYIKYAEDEESISFLYEGACSWTYVAFAEGIELDSIPEGFYLEPENETTTIGAKVDCCIEEGNGPRFISDDEARDRLRQISENLQKWVDILPYKKTTIVQK